MPLKSPPPPDDDDDAAAAAAQTRDWSIAVVDQRRLRHHAMHLMDLSGLHA